MSKKPEGEPPWYANVFLILLGLALCSIGACIASALGELGLF